MLPMTPMTPMTPMLLMLPMPPPTVCRVFASSNTFTVTCHVQLGVFEIRKVAIHPIGLEYSEIS